MRSVIFAISIPETTFILFFAKRGKVIPPSSATDIEAKSISLTKIALASLFFSRAFPSFACATFVCAKMEKERNVVINIVRIFLNFIT